MTETIQSTGNENNLFKFTGPYRIYTSYNVSSTLERMLVFSPKTIGKFINTSQQENPLQDISKETSTDAIVTIFDQDFEMADEAKWDMQFAGSPETLDLLAREGHEEYYGGLADEFDPNNDPDAP